MNARAAADTISYAAAGTVTFLGLTADEWGIIGVLVGIFFAAMTFMTTLWFKHKHLKLAKFKISVENDDDKE